MSDTKSAPPIKIPNQCSIWGQLWEWFMANNPNTTQKIYVVYTHYENQDQGFYDVYIGTQERLVHFSDKIDVAI